MIKLPAISIRWKLISLCIGLVTVPSVIMGLLSYNTLKEQTYLNIEKDLRIIAADWQKITNAYIEQMNRVLKREEVLVEQRLKSVAEDVKIMLEAFRTVHGDTPSLAAKRTLFDKISQIRLGRGGYVALIDIDGTYLVSKGRSQDGLNLRDMDETKVIFMQRIELFKDKLEGGDHQLMHHQWAETGYDRPRMKMSVLSYFKPWQLIISANIYYSDFKSYEVEHKLKYDLKQKMADQRIGEDGYIWVINSDGEYVVSKDLLRDGEDISEIQDEEGALIIKNAITTARDLKPQETAVYYYTWRNLGESKAYEKVSAIAYIPEWGWILGASAYHKDFLQGLKIIRTNIMVVCICAILVGSIIAYFAALLISKPLKQLQRKSLQVSNGDLNAVIDPEIVAQKDELGSLAAAFNTMVGNLNNLAMQQRETNIQLVEAKERAEAANVAKGDFLARMSHEIRTPLNAVTGLTHILLKSEMTAEQRDYLNKVQIASSNLLEVINDILDFSKVEAGRLEMAHTPFDLDQVVERLADLFSSRAAKKDLELVFAVSPQVPRQLIGDAGRLTQILTNLVENAIKFTEKGEIVVAVKCEDNPLGNQGQATLQFRVSDTGIGIAAEVLPTLFEPFTQADSYLTRKHVGTGLGLAICQRLVELMGGTIEVSSHPGQGSAFYFTVPFSTKQKVLPRFDLPVDLHGLRALVVDDSAAARQMLEDLLESMNFSVSSVDNGQGAIEALNRAAKEAPYQLVLLDWKMPGMDGIETAAAIHNHSGLNRLPIIIMVTAYSRELVQARIDPAMVDGLLLKPIKPSQLFDTIMALFKPKMDQAPQTEIKKTLTHDALAGRRVLLVEDSELNRDVAKALLEDARMLVESAENGQEAVDKVVQSPEGYYDAVLMDIQMPVMDGYRATGIIKALDEEQATHSGAHKPGTSIPIIALTAHAMTGEKDKCLNSGMDDYIAKPIDEQELYRVLSKWILPQQEKAKSVNQPNAPQEAGDHAVLNVNGALKRLGGRKPLYINMVKIFEPEFGGAHDAIFRYLGNGEREKALRMAHTTKGVAATIGAEALQHVAGALEQTIRAEDPAEDLLKSFKSELKQALAAVEGFLQQNQ